MIIYKKESGSLIIFFFGILAAFINFFGGFEILLTAVISIGILICSILIAKASNENKISFGHNFKMGLGLLLTAILIRTTIPIVTDDPGEHYLNAIFGLKLHGSIFLVSLFFSTVSIIFYISGISYIFSKKNEQEGAKYMSFNIFSFFIYIIIVIFYINVLNIGEYYSIDKFYCDKKYEPIKSEIIYKISFDYKNSIKYLSEEDKSRIKKIEKMLKKRFGFLSNEEIGFIDKVYYVPLINIKNNQIGSSQEKCNESSFNMNKEVMVYNEKFDESTASSTNKIQLNNGVDMEEYLKGYAVHLNDTKSITGYFHFK